MKISLFNNNNLGIVEDNTIYDSGNELGWDSKKPQESLVNLIERFDDNKSKITEICSNCDEYSLKDVKLDAPVPKPGKIITAPVNYYLHQDEMNEQFNNAEYTINNLVFFLKAPTSIIGPGETIRLPFQNRHIDHEAELAFVVGKRTLSNTIHKASEFLRI